MSYFRLSAATTTLLFCFAALTCLSAASLLWTLNQFSPSSWLTVAAGQKFSPTAEYFSAIQLWVWLQLGATVATATVLAWWLHGKTVRPFDAAVAAAQQIGSGNLATATQFDGIQNNKLLSTMQEMNTCLSGIIAAARSASAGIAGGAGALAHSGQQWRRADAEQRACLAQTAGALEPLGALARQHAESASRAGALARTAAGAAAGTEALLDALDTALAGIAASARRLDAVNGALDDLAAMGETLALSASLEAARAGVDGRAFAVVAAEVKALAQRAAGSAAELRDLGAANQRDARSGADAGARLRLGMREAGRAVSGAVQVHEEIARGAQSELAAIALAGRTLAAADQACRHHAALAERAAAGTAAVRDQAGALLRLLAGFTLGGRYAALPLIHLAHSNPAQQPQTARAAAAKRRGAAHLISIL